MKKNKIKSIIISGLITSSILSTSVSAKSLTELDIVYRNAYTSTINAVNSKTQKDVNIARNYISQLKKLDPKNNGIPTWSSMLDKVQGPIYSEIVSGIKRLKSQVSSGKDLNQADINYIRTLCIGDVNDDSDDIPKKLYASGWSEELDILQRTIINRVSKLVKKAELERTKSSIKDAQIVIDDLKTCVTPSIVDWAKSMEVRLSKVEIREDESKPDSPLYGIVLPGSSVKLPLTLGVNDVAALVTGVNESYNSIFNYDGVDREGINIVFYHAKGGENSVNAPKKGGSFTLYIFDKTTGELKYKGIDYIRVDTGVNISVNGNSIIFTSSPKYDGVFETFFVDPSLQLFPDKYPDYRTIWNYGVAAYLTKNMSTEEVAKAFYDRILLQTTASVPFPKDGLKLEGNKIIFPSNLKFSLHGIEDSTKTWK